MKANILKALASTERERWRFEHEQRERDRRSTHGWRLLLSDLFSSALAALETLSRGFTLGFGCSFIFESLLLNRDFYYAEEDLKPRVRRATFRAAVLGLALAVMLHGGSMFLPHALRYKWLGGGK